MNTRQIEAILKSDLMTRDLYRGTFSMDEVPRLKMRPGCFIINTDDRDEPGEHWLAVYNDNGHVEYFDSYGLPPIDKRLFAFLGDNYKYNATKLQLLFSNACGFYCVYNILHRARGRSMEDIIKVLKRSDGDFIVKEFLYRHYKPLFY